MLVEPDIATTGLPFNWSIVRMSSAFRAANRVADRKCEFVNATWRCRSALLVVEEQTRSTVPFIMSGMRLDDVTGSVSTVTLERLSSRLTASTIFMQMSTAYPIAFWSPSR